MPNLSCALSALSLDLFEEVEGLLTRHARHCPGAEVDGLMFHFLIANGDDVIHLIELGQRGLFCLLTCEASTSVPNPSSLKSLATSRALGLMPVGDGEEANGAWADPEGKFPRRSALSGSKKALDGAK